MHPLGLSSPTTAYAGGFNYLQNVTNLDINRRWVWKIPLNLSFGSEFRLENYQQKRGEEASWIDGGALTLKGKERESGFQMFPGFQPENEVNKYKA